MRSNSSIPPISEREARISILASAVFNYIFRQVTLTALLTWRGWSE
jgi:hypothetical protein